MYSPIRAECQDVPQAVKTIRFTWSSCSSRRFSPPSLDAPSSSSTRPRSVFRKLSGCSMISFSMKCA